MAKVGDVKYQIITGEAQLALLPQIIALRKKVWPDFIRLSDEVIFRIYELYADYQIAVWDVTTNELIAVANAMPLLWQQSLAELSNDGVGWVIATGLKQLPISAANNLLCAISVTVAENQRKHGISKILLQQLKRRALQENFSYLIVPVRPTLKSLYPLIAMDEYIGWKNNEGRIFDPWLRVHEELGGTILHVCYKSAEITADIRQWEKWSGLRFPGSGSYLMPGALAPLEISYFNNSGTYIEPNVWVYYWLANP